MRLTPFAALGVETAVDPSVKLRRLGYCFGINAEFGKFHRVFIGPNFLTFGLQADSSNANHYRSIIGPSLIVGYKGTARFGLLWQIAAGAGYSFNNQTTSSNFPAPVVGLGLGYKF
jgi:hypothetical protein